MAKTYVFVAIITFGVIIAVQGFRLLRKMGTVRVIPPERVLIELFGGSKPDEQLKVLGRIRIVLGVFLVVIGIWALT